MAKKSKIYYQVGLGGAALARARIIFGVVLILTLISIGGAVVAEAKSGNLREALSQPFQSIVAGVKQAFEPTPTRDYSGINTVINIESSGNVTLSSPTPTPATTTKPKSVAQPVATKKPTATPVPTQNADDWFNQQKAANDAWYQDQVNKQNADYNAAVQKQNDQYNADVQQMNADLEAWKKAHGF